MNRIINIPNRLNWIDWAKVFAISFVVFGHIPQAPGSFSQSYITTFHLPLFYFISGFLTKKEYLNKKTIIKYWHTLIIPYLCYNLLFYPYWVIRHLIEAPEGGFYAYIKPIVGIFLLQADTTYSEQLNGVTWFIASLIGYKLILSACNKYKYGYIVILILIVISSFIYVHNQFHLYIRDLTPVGFFKCLPFYFIGYYSKQMNYMPTIVQKYDGIVGFLYILISILLFSIYRETNNMIIYGIRYWLISIFAILGVIGVCKHLDRIHSVVIDSLSIGTIVIMGLHFILIGTTNFVLEKTLSIDGKIIYPWYIVCVLVLIFEAMIYPIILFLKNNFPFMLGKKSEFGC